MLENLYQLKVSIRDGEDIIELHGLVLDYSLLVLTETLQNKLLNLCLRQEI